MMSAYFKGHLQELSFLRSASAFTFEVMSIVKQTHKHCWIFSLSPLHYIDTNLEFDGTQGLLMHNSCQTCYECKSCKTNLHNL